MSLTTLPADYYDLSFLDKINYSDDDDDDDDENNNNNECVVKKEKQCDNVDIISIRKNRKKKKKSDDDSDDDDDNDFEDNSTNNYIVLNTNCNNNNSNNVNYNSNNQLLFNNSVIIHTNRSTSDDDIQWSHLMIMPVDDDCCCPLQLNNLFHNDIELFYAIQLHLFEQWCKKMNRILPHSILSCLFYRCFFVNISQDYYYYDDQQISLPSTTSSSSSISSDDKHALARIIPYYLASIMYLNPAWICSCVDIITVLRGHITLHKVIYDCLKIPMDHHHHQQHHHDSVDNTSTTTTNSNSTTANTIPSGSHLHNQNLSYLEVIFNTIVIIVQRYQKNISAISHSRHHHQQHQQQEQEQQQQQEQLLLTTHDSTVVMTQLCDLFTLLCILFCDHSIQTHFYTIISYTIQSLLDIIFEIQLNSQLYYQQQLSGQQLSGQQLQELSNDHIVIPSDGDNSTINYNRVVSTSNTGVSEGNNDIITTISSSMLPLQLKSCIVKLSKLPGNLSREGGEGVEEEEGRCIVMIPSFLFFNLTNFPVFNILIVQHFTFLVYTIIIYR